MNFCSNNHRQIAYDALDSSPDSEECPLCELRAAKDTVIQDLRTELEEAQSKIRETARDAVAAERERAYHE
jgi:hypothetical protein